MEDPGLPKKAPRCNCPIHSLVYLAMETIDMLVGEREKKAIDEYLGDSDESHTLDALKACILAGALATFHHDLNSDPGIAMTNFQIFWNKLSYRQAEWENNPEQFKSADIDKKLEDLSS